MENFIGIIAWGSIAYYIYLKLFAKKKKETAVTDIFNYENQKKSFRPKTDREKNTEAHEIAKGIKTHKGIDGLQNKIDALSDKMDEYHYNDKETMYDKTKEKQEIMERALEYAYSNPYRYYYCGDVDIDTPLKEIKLIGKTISVQKYNELDQFNQRSYSQISLDEAENIEDANEIAKDDSILDRDEIDILIKFRKIIESDETEDEKEKKFNKLVSKSEYLIEQLELDEYQDGSLYQQYKQIQIKHQKIKKLGGLPFANIFIDNGYENIDEIITLSDDKIKSMYGIGPKSLVEIRRHINILLNLKEKSI